MKNFLDIEGFYKTPSQPGIYTVKNLKSVYEVGGKIERITYKGYFSNGACVSVQNENGVRYFDVNNNGTFTDATFELTKGANIITYRVYAKTDEGSEGNLDNLEQYKFTIYGIPSKNPLAPWTIEEQINRLLDLQNPLLYNGNTLLSKRRFRFDLSTIPADKREIFTRRNAPEFTFTRSTLRENLQLIGGYIHAEPRLIYNSDTQDFDTITFDFYGGNDYALYYDVNKKGVTYLNTYNYEDKTLSWNAEQGCNELDAYVDNLVNKIRSDTAAVGQPYEKGGQGFRVETTYARATDGNLYFPTQYPVHDIKSFKARWRNSVDENGNAVWYDLTTYIYEKTIYDTQLSAYDDGYPFSKAYALYYTLNEKGINGFFFVNNDITGGALSNYAIQNIMTLLGVNIGSNITTITQNLAFELVYTPVYSARVQHSKQYIGDWLEKPRTLNYAQSDNMVETQYFGENIKGAVERLGTLEKLYTFTCKNIETIPKSGLLWSDEYYIATVSVECMHDKFKVTCGLSKNFNRISQYVGLTSYKRIYEVSSRMVQQRTINWKDYLLVTDEIPADYTQQSDCLVSPKVYSSVLNSLGSTNFGEVNKASAVNIALYDKAKKFISRVYLPVVASAEGNVIEFSWEYQDNFSAGQRLISIDGQYYGSEVEYADYYGRAYFANWVIGFPNYDATDQKQFPWAYDSGMADAFKLYGTATQNGVYQLVRKDNRETLAMNGLLEFVTDNNAFIIGSALARLNPMVTGVNSQGLKAVTLNKRLNRLSQYVAEENIKSTTDVVASWLNLADGGVNCNAGLKNTQNARAWAFITPYKTVEKTYDTEDGQTITVQEKTGGELVLGKNLAGNSSEDLFKFSIIGVHDIYEYLKNKQ